MKGRDKKTGRFLDGNPGKPVGATSEKTKIWNEISDWFKSDGIKAYQDNLKDMLVSGDAKKKEEGMKRMEVMMEYFAPKLARTEVEASVTNPPSIDPSKYTDEELEKLDELISKSHSS